MDRALCGSALHRRRTHRAAVRRRHGVEPVAASAGPDPHQGGGAHRAALSRPGRERQRHDLPDRSVRPVHVRQPGGDPHPRVRGGRAAGDEVLRADAARLGAARDGVLRAVGQVAGVDVPRVPGPQEGRQRNLGRPAGAPDCHRRADRRLPGHGPRHHRARQRPGGAAVGARLRVGHPRNRAEPGDGARLARPRGALQPGLRSAFGHDARTRARAVRFGSCRSCSRKIAPMFKKPSRACWSPPCR